MLKCTNFLGFYTRFFTFAVISTDERFKRIVMKQNCLIYIIGVIFSLLVFASCSSDSGDETAIENDSSTRTETWNVIIEPEYVLTDTDKSAHRVTSVMEGVDEKGDRIATFGPLDIDGIELLEGYRYKLQLAAKVSSTELSNSSKSFRLSKILEKTFVGVSQQDKREVEMEITPVRVKPKDQEQTWSYETLCGKIIGTDEKIDMLMGEIWGLDYKEFYGNNALNRLLVKVSITPSAKPIYEDKQQRIRLIQVLSKDALWKDSVVYMDSSGNIDPEASATQDPQFGDFELSWSFNSKKIGKGVLHAENNNASIFGLIMDAENNMTKFFVDSIFKKPYATMEPQKVTFDIDDAVYNGALQYGFVGYSADAYYYNIKDWKYMAIAKIDGTYYQFVPIVDYENSSMAYDMKAKQWLGVITIKQVDFSQAYYVPSPPWTEKYVMSPPLKLVFSTTKKIK